jgi:hypothetical protein
MATGPNRYYHDVVYGTIHCVAHLTVYLPDDIEQQVRALAKADGISVNKWIAARLADVARRSWSPAFLAAAGADPGFPELEDGPFGADAPREPLE